MPAPDRNYESTRYTDGRGIVYPMRTQPATRQLTIETVPNNPSTADVSVGASQLKVSTPRRSTGVKPRKVNIKLTADGAVEGLENYSAGETFSVVWFNPTTFAAIELQDTGTYHGIACEVIGLTCEDR